MGIIGSIRKHSGWAVAIVGIAIIAFIFSDLTKNNNRMPDMGKINGTTISAQVFNERVTEFENNYKAQTGRAQIDNETESQIRDQVWQSLVQEELFGEQMALLGIEVTPAEVNDMYAGTFIHPYLSQMFTDPTTGQYNVQQVKYLTDNFDQLDSTMRLQWVELEKQIKTDRAQQKYTNMIQQGLYTPKAIANYVAKLGATATDSRVVMASYMNVKDDEVSPEEADYKTYYDNHKNEYRVRDEVRNIDFVLFPINPTQEDMAQIQADVEKVWSELQTTEDDMAFFVSAESDTPYDSSYVKASSFGAPMDSIIASKSAGEFIEPRIVGNAWVLGKVENSAMRPDSVRASIIWVLNNRAGGNITRSEAQAKERADSVLMQVRRGMPFETAVDQYTDGDKSKQGDEGWQTDGSYGFLNEDIINTGVGECFVIEHPQKVGYCVVKVTGKTTPSKKYRVALITHNIEPSNTTEKNVYNQANKFMGENRTYAEMVAAAQQQNMMVRNAQVSKMSNSVAGLPDVREVVRWAFDDDVEENTVADKVFNTDNAYIVVALKEIYPVGVLPLDKVRPMIESQVRLDKKAELLMARVEEAVKATKDINAIATRLGATVDSVTNVNYNDSYLNRYGMEPKVQAAIVLSKEGSLVGPVKGANGVYVANIDARRQVITGDEALQSAAESIRQQMNNVNGQKVNGVFTMLKDKSKIVDQRNEYF